MDARMIARIVAACFIIVLFTAADADAGGRRIRAKREMDMEAAMCLYGCASGYLNHSVFEASSESRQGGMICRHADTGQLREVCRALNESQGCFKECPEGPLKTMIEKIRDFACIDHFEELMKYAPCFSDSCGYIENACRPKCGTMASAIHYTPEEKRKLEEIRKFSSNNDQAGSSSSSSLDDQDDEGPGFDVLGSINLAGACRFVDCYVNCSQEPLTKKCGEDNYKFFHLVVADIVPIAYNGLFPNMTSPPQECERVLSMSEEITTTPATQSGWHLHVPHIWTLICIYLLSMIWIKYY